MGCKESNQTKTKFQVFFGSMPDIPDFFFFFFFFFLGGGGGTVDTGSKPAHEEKLRVAPIDDTHSVLSFKNIKGVKKVHSAIKLCSYYFRCNVCNDINVTETH